MPAVALLLRLVGALAAIHGTVRVAGHGQAAAGVHIALDGTDRAVTDSTGQYHLAGLTLGAHEFRFMAPGYDARRVTIFLADTSDLALDVELAPRPTVLPPIEIVAHQIAGATVDNMVGSTTWHEAGQYRFTTDWQRSQPAGGVDINQAIASLPGVATRNDDATALSIRGGRGSENMILLDGVPLIGAVHFAGAPSAINPDAIAMFDVHTGVSSARYDGALSGVIDLHTVDIAPRQFQLTGSLSSTDVRSVARAPLGGAGSLLVGIRSSFRSLFGDADQYGSSTGYQDGIATAHFAVGRSAFSLVGFGSGNQLTWRSAAATTSNAVGSTDPRVMQTVVPTSGPGTGDAATWWSTAGGATWTLPLGRSTEWHTVGWWTGSHATISALAGSGNQQLLSGISELGITSEVRTSGRHSSLLFGTEITRPRTSYVLSTPATTGDSATQVNLRAAPTFASAYGEWDWHGWSRLDVRAGLRANSNFGESLNIDPRVTINLRADPSTRFEIGFGRTHQGVQSMLNEENLTSALIGPALPVAATSRHQVARAEQWEIGVEHQIGTAVVLSLDGYTRNWEHVLTPTATTGGLFVDGAPQYGDGAAHGVVGSIIANRGRFSLHTSIGITDATQTAGGVTYHTGYDQPWSFNGTLDFRATDRTAFQFRWTTGAGQLRTAAAPDVGFAANGSGEITGITTALPGSVNAIRLAGPMRLDLSARHLWPIGGGERRSSLSTSVRLENLLNRPDPIGIMEQPGGSLQLLRGTPRAVVFELGWVY